MLSPAQTAMLLLCGDLDDGLRPLGIRELRTLSQRMSGLELLEPGRDVSIKDFIRLGYEEDEAARLMSLLDREHEADSFLARLAENDIHPITRISDGYPRVFHQKLGDTAPPVLFYAGSKELLGRPSVSLVGSRSILQPGREFAAKIGRCSGEQGYVLVSGGASGADTAAQNACLEAGGSVISFIADSLWSNAKKLSSLIKEGKLLLISIGGPYCVFSAARAQSRNRLIHSYSPKTFVAGSAFETGGTWAGTVENLKKNRSQVFVFNDCSRGSLGLISLGATPVRLEDVGKLSDLEPGGEQQESLL